jgi:uncharacterized protein with HEPN domain
VRSADELIDDIVAATRDAARIVRRGHRRFETDPLLIRAAKNIVSEIGEAAKALDASVTDQIPGVPWRAIRGMRDKVVHDYPDLDVDLLWDTLVHGMPALEQAIGAYRSRR